MEVSGFIDSQGNITASSLKLIQMQFTQGSVLDIKGTVSQLNTGAKTFVINNSLTIDYSAANFTGITEAGLANGLYLNISTEQNLTNGILFASIVDFIEETLVSGISYEIEGTISRYVSVTDFDVDGIAASINAQTVFNIGTTAALKRDAWVIIKGASNTQGKVIIEEISLPDAVTNILIEAKIETIDHCLLLHPEQKACIKNKQPMYTVGSLLRRLQMEALLETIVDLLSSTGDIGERLKELANKIKTVFELMPSGKHMIGRDLGRLEPTDSLAYQSNG